MIVVDASVVLDALLHTPVGAAVRARMFDAAEGVHAPHLLDLEVVQVLRRLALSGRLTLERSQLALSDLSGLPIRRYPHGAMLPRIWQLRDNLTAYDAAYVTLAELLQAPLLTRDRRIAAAPGHGAVIELV